MTDPSDFRSVSRAVRDAVSSRTGYPAESLDLDLTLDSDLGFVGTVYEDVVALLCRQFPAAPPQPAEPFRTIRDVARWLFTGPPADADPPAPSRPAPAPAPSVRVGVDGLYPGQTYSVADLNAVPGFTAALFLGREPEGGMYRFGPWEPGEVIALTTAEVADRVFRVEGDCHRWTDPLTGLANRGAFKLALTAAVTRAGEGGLLSILALDVDGFSHLNRSYGMIVGDLVLTELAGFMRTCLNGDLLARTGGDRFGVLLPGHDLPAALLVAERLRQAVGGWRWDAPDYGISGVSLTVTIGAAALGPGITSADDLFRAGNEAFYRAEAAGSNRVSE